MRGILKRASVFSHPESEPQKKIALGTEQDSTPYPSVSYGGFSASGTQPSITSTDQNTSTGDVTREVRTGPTQDVTRTSSSDDIGDEGGQRRRKQSRAAEFVVATKREPRGVRDERNEHH